MTRWAACWGGAALAVGACIAIGTHLMRKRDEAADGRAVEAELRGYASGLDDGAKRAESTVPVGEPPHLWCVK